MHDIIIIIIISMERIYNDYNYYILKFHDVIILILPHLKLFEDPREKNDHKLQLP